MGEDEGLRSEGKGRSHERIPKRRLYSNFAACLNPLKLSGVIPTAQRSRGVRNHSAFIPADPVCGGSLRTRLRRFR